MKAAKYLCRALLAVAAILASLGALCGAALVAYLDWREKSERFTA